MCFDTRQIREPLKARKVGTDSTPERPGSGGRVSRAVGPIPAKIVRVKSPRLWHQIRT